ncbi:MAG: hypothetical protein KIT31_35045, partial [Deltaproteobacteria bacterium]|nr:hypothetical protein [Deltaproteobacteria bacterium]
RASAYLRAVEPGAAVARVPDEHVRDLAAGTRLLACRGNVRGWCRDVGSVVAVLPGEVSFKHPSRDAQVRGRLVEVRLTDPDAVAEAALFVGI